MLKQFSSRLRPATLKEDLAPYFREARRRLSDEVPRSAVRTWPNKVRCVDPHQPLMAPQVDSNVQKEIHAALLRGKQVSVIYRASHKHKPKEYSPVNVLGLVERGPITYLVATFFDYEDVRIIALHRIQDATMLNSDNKAPANFDLDEYIASGAFGFGAVGRTINIELTFYNGAGNHLLEARLADNQVAEELDEGILSAKATVLDTKRLRWWLLGFGSDVEVVGPAKLRREIQQSLEDAAHRYSKPLAISKTSSRKQAVP